MSLDMYYNEYAQHNDVKSYVEPIIFSLHSKQCEIVIDFVGTGCY